MPWAALRPLVASLDQPLHEVLAGAAADRVLERFLRAHRELEAAGRAVCAESIFGVSLWRRRLRALVGHDASPRVLLGALLRDLADQPDAESVVDHALPPALEPTDWRDLTSVPNWLADQLTAAFGSDAPAVAAAFNVPGPIFLRANTLRQSREVLAEMLAKQGVTTVPTSHARDGLRVTSPRPNLLGLGLDGAFEVQDEGSQLLAEFLGAQLGESVLDLCAGAGGKTLALAGHVGQTGLVHAADLDLARLERLRHRALKAGARVAIEGATCRADLRFPRVLVDAPCSELGVLRRGPDARWRLNPDDFAPLPALQRSLLERGLSHLAPGGQLVYATCTFRREENEDVVEAVLAANATCRLVRTLTLRTDLHGTDCFFAALLERPQ